MNKIEIAPGRSWKDGSHALRHGRNGNHRDSFGQPVTPRPGIKHRQAIQLEIAHRDAHGRRDRGRVGALDLHGEPPAVLEQQQVQEKRQLDAGVSAPEIDQLYQTGMRAGAIGGKLLGAGGGGFMLLFVPPERQAAVRAALKGYHEVPFAINAPGSTVVRS